MRAWLWSSRYSLSYFSTVFVTVHALLGIGCQKKSVPVSDVVAESKLTLTQKGRTVYTNACITCHNNNPKLEGPLGPAVAGSSFELIERRVLFADYPQDYKPKRATKVMVALPHLKDDIKAIHAYLSSVVSEPAESTSP